MKRRIAIVFFAGALTASCVDLFHSTDFATLCTDSPTDPRCVDGGGPADTSTPDTSTKPPHPSFCTLSHSAVYDLAVKVCARIGGCVGPLPDTENLLGSTEFGACVIDAQLAYDCAANPMFRPAGPTDDFWYCVQTANDCDAIRSCVFPNGTVDVCGNSDGGTGTFRACGDPHGGNTDTQLLCNVNPQGPAIAATPCVMNGQTCSRKMDGTTSSISACVGAQGFNCTTTGCDGDNLHASDCSNGTVDRGLDCSALSATCVASPSGPGCKPNAVAAECDDTNAPVCGASDDGGANVVQACIGQKLVTVDCGHLGDKEAAVGLPCDVTTVPPLYAISEACIDRSGGCVDTDQGCTGNQLSACSRGRVVQVDCTAVGFGGCDKTANPPQCSQDHAPF